VNRNIFADFSKSLDYVHLSETAVIPDENAPQRSTPKTQSKVATSQFFSPEKFAELIVNEDAWETELKKPGY